MIRKLLPRILAFEVFKRVNLEFALHTARCSEDGKDERYVVYLYVESWPILVYTFDDEVWRYNRQSNAGLALASGMSGRVSVPVPLTAHNIKSVAKYGVLQTVISKLTGTM